MYETNTRTAAGHALMGGVTAQGRLADAVQTIEKARLHQQLDQLAKVLAGCHEHAGSLENGVDRIIGPVPQDTCKDATRPPMTTVEQKLAEAISYAELLLVRLGSTQQRLNSAV